jgi:hypothetical protein
LRNKLKLVTVLAIVVIVGGILLACYALVIKAQAKSLLADVTALAVGRATEADAQQFAQRHRWFLVSNSCNDNGCDTVFKVRNKWLSALRIEPRAEFNVHIGVKNGNVNRIGASLLRSMDIFPTFPASAGLVDEYAELPEDYAARGRYVFPTPVGKPYLRVVLDSQASAVQRQHAFAFSFRCLVKPGWECNLSCDYLPLAWQDWKVSLRESGFPMDDFNRSYPKSTRCGP